MFQKIVAILSFVLLSTFAANAYEHTHAPNDVLNQFYYEWKMPNGGNRRTASCCNKQDCYPTPIVKFDDGKYYARRREDGMWIFIPDEKLEQNLTDAKESPDHQSHACLSPPINGNYVYCATLGTGM